MTNNNVLLSTIAKHDMNTIIAVWNSGSKGKSATLRELANLIMTNYPNYKSISPRVAAPIASGDFRLVVEINGVIVGIESKGDPNTNLEERLFELVDKYNCSLIFCSTRTKGETVWAVQNIANTKGFQKIWTSTYQIEDENTHEQINKLKAKHILELTQDLNLL